LVFRAAGGSDEVAMRKNSNRSQEIRMARQYLALNLRPTRISGVSRFKICTFELGSGLLTTAEQDLIRASLQGEADRLRDISAQIEFS
jgi:hypothetical protein